MGVVDRQSIINDICKSSNLKGKELEKLKLRLCKLNDAGLQAELTNLISNQKQDKKVGLQVETSSPKSNPQKTIYLQSGRKVVYSKIANGKIVMKYYGTDGTQLNPDYFKKVEGQISISEDGKKYTITKNGKKTTLQAKDPSKGAIDQNLARLNNEEKRLKKTKKEQGFIGKSWDWIKNTTGIGDSSDKAQKQIEAEKKLLNQVKTGKISKKDFKAITGVEYSKENLEKFKRGELSQATAKIDGYKEGQEMAVDVAGDIISGIAAVGIYTAAVAAVPFTGGASIAVGIAAATASGALIKAGVKALDAKTGGRKYSLKDFGHDALTGGFSGLLAPITGGMGGAVGKTVATKLGIQAVKQVGKEVAEEAVEQGVKQGLKTALTNPTGYEYVGGTLVKRGTALAAEMATDGALGGAIDNAFRTGIDGGSISDIAQAAGEGFIGGAILSPVIGGGMKAVGKTGHYLGSRAGTNVPSMSYDEVLKMRRNGEQVRIMPDNTIIKTLPDGSNIEIGSLIQASTVSTKKTTSFKEYTKNSKVGRFIKSKLDNTKNMTKQKFKVVKEGLTDLLLNHTSLGRKIKEGYDNAVISKGNTFKSSKISQFDKVKEQLKTKFNDFDKIALKLQNDQEFVRLFNSFIAKNATNKPELAALLKNYDISGMNDAKIIKDLIETSGVGITKFAQIISKDKIIMSNFEKMLPPEEFKSLQKALIDCQSKCDFSRTPAEAQVELDKAFPLKTNSKTAVVGKNSPKSEYIITEEVSAGSVGATYWAIDKNGNKVIVKMLKAGVDMEELGMEEKLFKKLIGIFASTPEDEFKYSTMIHNQYKDWAEELDFKQEGINNQKLTKGAKRYSVAQVQKVSKDGTILIMDGAKGVQMKSLVEMLEFYKNNGLKEYMKKYQKELSEPENAWLKNPQKIMDELPVTLTKTFDEQMLFIKKGGETVMHGDPHMGNLFVYNDANNKLKIEFIDTGNCVSRNSTQIQGDIAFFSNYLVGNSDGVAKYFMRKSGIEPTKEPELLKQISKSIDERVFKKGENITQFAEVQKELNTILEEAGLDIGSDESNALKAQLQFISNISTLNALNGKPLDVTPIFLDIPPALMQMVKNKINPLKSIKDALLYAYHNKVDALGNALQFKVKNTDTNMPDTDVVLVKGNNNKTFKFARSILKDIKEIVKNRSKMTETEFDEHISNIAKNAHILKSQIYEVINSLK